jgi:hypothetical protein
MSLAEKCQHSFTTFLRHLPAVAHRTLQSTTATLPVSVEAR